MKSLRLQSLLVLSLLAALAIVSVTAVRRERRIQADLDRPAPIRFPKPGGWIAQHPAPPTAPTGRAAVGSPGAARAAFVDVSARAGLRYRWTIPGPRPLDILQTIGNGCAFLDYNNDGDLDILLVGPTLALYQGDGRGHFTDVSRAAGLDKLSGRFLGCAVGDYDDDGFDDVYISGYRTGLLLHNGGGKRFTDVTQQSGLKAQPWGTSCAWGDIDGDGRLDLYVGDYVKFDPETGQRLCNDGKLDGVCSPVMYDAEQGVLYHNDGHGRFHDVTRAWNASSQGKTLGATFVDFDRSGRQSLSLANDTMRGELFRNGGARGVDIGRRSGLAYDGHTRVHSGMGMDWGDYDNDGRPDLAVMAFNREPKCVYHNLGSGLFQEISDSLTLTAHTLDQVAFGVKWLDYDNDGWLDLMITNGGVRDNIAQVDQSATFLQPTQLFRNDHGRLMVDLSAGAGPALQRPILGRGLAVGDYDNDGRVDALVVDSQGVPLLLHNESAPVGHWLTLRLEGTRSNRDGYGATVTATVENGRLTRVCHSDGSYLSASDKRVHLGLGQAGVVSILTVRWPSGHTDVLHRVAPDRELSLREGGKRAINR